jgi:hypothetical protein
MGDMSRFSLGTHRLCLAIVCATTFTLSRGQSSLAQSPTSQQSQSIEQEFETAARSLSEGKPRVALDAMARAEAIEPENPWVHYYRAAAKYQLGDHYGAMSSGERAATILKELGDPDPELAELVRQVRGRSRREVASLSLQTGLAFDSNVTFLQAGAAGLGTIAGREDGLFGSSESFMVAPIADEHQRLEAFGHVANTWHFAVEQFDVGVYGGGLRYARRLGDNWEADIRYNYDQYWLGNDPFVEIHSVSPSLSYLWRCDPVQGVRPDKSTLYYQFEVRDYRFPTTPRFDRDGMAHHVGFTQDMLIRPMAELPWDVKLSAGYRYEADFTKGAEFDVRYHNFLLGLEVPLVRPWCKDRLEYLLIPNQELKFTYGAAWQIGDYREVSVTDRDHDKRSDYIVTHTFALSQTIFDDPDYGRMVLHALINWSDANSNITTPQNISPFTYDRTVYGVQLEWTW